MKKRGFTFAELMISLVVIAIITAILYPTISELAPNNNKQLFKAAYKTIELVVSELANSENGVPTLPEEMCEQFKQKLNFVPRGEVASSAENKEDECVGDNNNGYEFQTSNGMRWLFIQAPNLNSSDSTFETGSDGNIIRGGKTTIVYVDVNAANNKIASNCTENSSAPSNYDYVKKWVSSGTGSFCGGPVVQDTFAIEVTPSGRVQVLSPIGKNHLLGITED